MRGEQKAFEVYNYEIIDGSRLVARYWHDHRGDDQRLVVLYDKDGLTRFVAVGAYDPGSSGWKRCSYFWWTGTEGETHPKQGFFNGDQWASLIAEAESGRPLDHFGR